jgi:hypothetical protein
MKRLLFLFCLLLHILFVDAQSLIISQGAHPYAVYLGLTTPLAAFIADVPCSQIELKANQGKIKKTGNCDFEYEADSIGDAIISIYRIIGQKKIKVGQQHFRVKKIPKAIALVGRFNNSDTVSKNELIAQQGIRADFLSAINVVCIEGVKFNVIEYTTIILRKDSVIFTESAKSAVFTETIKAALDNLRTNDRIIFTNIKSVGPSGTTELLNPIEYIIKE